MACTTTIIIPRGKNNCRCTPEKRDIGLRRADVPGQFVKCLPLRVGLGGEDLLVLIEGNGAPLSVPNRRPLTLWDNRRGQPAHVQGEIVDAAQIDIGRDFPQFHGPQQVLRARFDQGTVDDIGVCFVLGGNDPPPMGFALLEFQDFGEHIPPCARGRLGIGRHHVGAGHLEMHEGNRVGLVATVEQAGVVGLVFGAEGLVTAALGVLAPESFPASEESEFWLHNRFGYKAWGHCPHLR